MLSGSEHIDFLLKENTDLIHYIYGDKFRERTFEQALESCYYRSIQIIDEISKELGGLEEDSALNTVKYNSQFALSFMLVSEYFQHFTESIYVGKEYINFEQIQYVFNILNMYRRFASELIEPVQLLNSRKSDLLSEVERYIENIHGDLSFHAFVSLSLLNDAGELKKAFGLFIDDLQQAKIQNGSYSENKTIMDLFSFPSVKAKPLRCYRLWIEAFNSYALHAGQICLSERCKQVLDSIMIEDKKGADYNRRRLAKKLIKCAIFREPLSCVHTSQSKFTMMK